MIVGIIPARGGSKGIKRKNLVEVCGKPLIFWTIQSALKSKSLHDVFVSTEDEEIGSYCHSLGIKVLHRPKRLSNDITRTIEVLGYHLGTDFSPDTSICTLQPTSPIRFAGTIDACIGKYLNNKSSILATGYDCKIQPFGQNNNLPRQKIKGFFYDDGNVYLHSPSALKSEVWSSKDALKFYTQEAETFEIDTEIDLKVAAFLLNELRGINAI